MIASDADPGARAAWRVDESGPGVLAGVRVLDLSRVLAGPYAAQMLADHGASVLKVEGPAGDDTRGWGPPFDDNGVSAYFAGLNRSKDNVGLNLRTDEGRGILGRLIDAADVVIENFKAGTMASWGFDYETVLAERRPDLVYCRITGYGVDGPLGGLPGYDAALQAYGGLMSINGYPDRNPLRVGVPIIDLVTANMTFSGVLLALLSRMKDGAGQLVDVALLDAVISILHPHSSNWIFSGTAPSRTGDVHPTVVPYQVFGASDGDVFIGAGNDRQFASLAGVLELPELARDPRFASNRDRHAHRNDLIDRLERRIAEVDRVELVAKLEAAGVPCSPVHTVEEALTSPQARHRGLYVDTPDYRGVGVPLSLSAEETAPPRPASSVGADTDRVLEALGFTAQDRSRLRDGGCVR